ncbi:hypothetical protein V8F20_004239 [Naviculisporaceae sp. PSN 640]
MEPISIAASSVSLVQSLTNVYAKASEFAKTYKETERDISALTDDLLALYHILSKLGQHEKENGAVVISDFELRDAVRRSILACVHVVKEIGNVLDQYSGGSFKRKFLWATFGRVEITRLQGKVVIHKDTLQMALTQVVLTQNTAIASDAAAIKAHTTRIDSNTEEIKSTVQEILFLLREKQPLQRQGSIRGHEVPQVCDQIRRTASEVKAEYLKHADRGNTDLAAAIQELDSLRDTALSRLQSSAAQKTRGAGNRGVGATPDEELIEVPEELTRFADGISRINLTRPRTPRPYFFSNRTDGGRNAADVSDDPRESSSSNPPDKGFCQPPSVLSSNDIQEQRNSLFPQPWDQNAAHSGEAASNDEWDTVSDDEEDASDEEEDTDDADADDKEETVSGNEGDRQQSFQDPPRPSPWSQFPPGKQTNSEARPNATNEAPYSVKKSSPGKPLFFKTEIRSSGTIVRPTEADFARGDAYKAIRAVCTVEEFNTALRLTRAEANAPPPVTFLTMTAGYGQDGANLDSVNQAGWEANRWEESLDCMMLLEFCNCIFGGRNQRIQTMISLKILPWTKPKTEPDRDEIVFDHVWNRNSLLQNVYRFAAKEFMYDAHRQSESPNVVRVIVCYMWLRRGPYYSPKLLQLIEEVVDSWQPTLNLCFPFGQEPCISDPINAGQLRLSGFGFRTIGSKEPIRCFGVRQGGALESELSAAWDYISRSRGWSRESASPAVATGMSELERYLNIQRGRGKNTSVNWGQKHFLCPPYSLTGCEKPCQVNRHNGVVPPQTGYKIHPKFVVVNGSIEAVAQCRPVTLGAFPVQSQPERLTEAIATYQTLFSTSSAFALSLNISRFGFVPKNEQLSAFASGSYIDTYLPLAALGLINNITIRPRPRARQYNTYSSPPRFTKTYLHLLAHGHYIYKHLPRAAFGLLLSQAFKFLAHGHCFTQINYTTNAFWQIFTNAHGLLYHLYFRLRAINNISLPSPTGLSLLTTPTGLGLSLFTAPKGNKSPYLRQTANIISPFANKAINYIYVSASRLSINDASFGFFSLSPRASSISKNNGSTPGKVFKPRTRPKSLNEMNPFWSRRWLCNQLRARSRCGLRSALRIDSHLRYVCLRMELPRYQTQISEFSASLAARAASVSQSQCSAWRKNLSRVARQKDNAEPDVPWVDESRPNAVEAVA